MDREIHRFIAVDSDLCRYRNMPACVASNPESPWRGPERMEVNACSPYPDYSFSSFTSDEEWIHVFLVNFTTKIDF
jgi:hypothetical protein